jgi:hypothetical protein
MLVFAGNTDVAQQIATELNNANIVSRFMVQTSRRLSDALFY